MFIERVKLQLAVRFVLLLAAIIFLSITHQAAAIVICVDKYTSTIIIPCSDQNAIVKPSDGTPPDYAGYGAVIAGLAAVGTIIWGIYQYGKGQITNRLDVGAIERAEIIYFQYWIHKTLENEAVQNYINLPQNQFPLYQMLLKELTRKRIDGFLNRLIKLVSYQRNWGKPITPKQRNFLRDRLAPPPLVPIPNARASQTVNPNSNVTLDGTGSLPTGGANIVSYTWLQTAGPKVVLTGADPKPTFTAPAQATVLSFNLTVKDSTGAVSGPATIYVTVT